MTPQSTEIWLGYAVKKLQQALDPEQILLFGSWARGTATRHSDIDLFVVWACNLSPLDRISQVLALLADAPYPVEVIVYTPDELTQRRDRPFIQQILSEGKVLYERGKASAGSSTMASTGD
ncbi:nucleotidyltransferase domain-containing protein [Oscillatoria sp. CS-180]|uniref:nucleotidyltransferase domain-containing protein n=1 Tax=Oscillatoria sp. CS-180 TaxID=3021720 RepID=UPI00232E3BA6|nr:nucleotidyltransferase domain-containing protein [Oscillatoria sp. CS-180]MDB9525158.1 nucleotidyltransferase domain-containing protein [Oscillatoria sp. CS-180]